MLLALAAMCIPLGASAAITFTPGHIYGTWDYTVTGPRIIMEYTETGTYLGSGTVPSLGQHDELHGIAFGPDGFLYVVKARPGYAGFSVLVLNRPGTIYKTYTYNNAYLGYVSQGKIAVDQRYIYVAAGADVIRFTVDDPNSGVSIYSNYEFMDVKIQPNGNLFVASSYAIDEITSDGVFVRNVVASNGIDFVDIRGVEYNPVTNKIFLTQLGTSGSRYFLMRLNASTGAFETGAFFDYADDLFLTQSGRLLVGNTEFHSPRIYSQNWTLVHMVGTQPRAFVTQYIDFSNDGHPDYFLSNSETHETATWYLNNNVFIGSVSGPTVPPSWPVVGIADFNNDGRPDYLLFNASTRQTRIWYMNNGVHSGTASGPTLLPGWEFAAVGDLNEDEHPDLVLYNPNTRRTSIWYMNNNTRIGTAWGPTLLDAWELAALADFNGDGHPDYLLYNPNTSQTWVWYMNNSSRIGTAWGPTLPTGWYLVGSADFNKDGHPDYLLLNTSTHATAMWHMAGIAHTGSRSGPTLPLDWALVAP